MMSNPDLSRRKDSLRQFLVTLFDRGELSQLASYPYTDMIDDVESIIESRARSADLSVNNYYDFLYSFHVSKENFRKAAQVMYECGTRLGVELCNFDGLKKQVIGIFVVGVSTIIENYIIQTVSARIAAKK